jgi:hypothetical protein
LWERIVAVLAVIKECQFHQIASSGTGEIEEKVGRHEGGCKYNLTKEIVSVYIFRKEY